MSLTQPSAGDLRESLRFERSIKGANLGGVRSTGWQTLIEAERASVQPTMGADAVIAGRMEGKTSFDIWVRSNSQTRTISNADRAVNTRTGAVYALGEPIDLTGRRRWLMIQAESGGSGADQG